MPDILNPYKFTSDFEMRMKNKFSKAGISYTNWSDDDISDIRISIREFYRLEQNGKCAYCKQSISLQSANNCHVEHIIPKSKYLKFIAEPLNLCTICADCNETKRNQEVLNDVPIVTSKPSITLYPRSSGAFKIIHPHFDKFKDHLMEINGYYLDKTKKGGYTILYCNLNRKLHKLGYENPIFSDTELRQIMNEYLIETDALKKMYILNNLKKMLILT